MENNKVKRAVYLNNKINQQIAHYGIIDEETESEYTELINSFTTEEDELFIKVLNKPSYS